MERFLGVRGVGRHPGMFRCSSSGEHHTIFRPPSRRRVRDHESEGPQGGLQGASENAGALYEGSTDSTSCRFARHASTDHASSLFVIDVAGLTSQLPQKSQASRTVR